MTRYTGLLLVALVHPGEVASADSSAVDPPDCGVASLFILLQLQGKPASIERIEASLPARDPRGYSMADLSTAAGACGLKLEGVRFGRADAALGGPAIAYFKDPIGGHFAVLRPLGATGTLVQLIDPPHAPSVHDYGDIIETPLWTGRILVPRKPRLGTGLAWKMTGLAGLALVITGFVRLWRGPVTSNRRFVEP